MALEDNFSEKETYIIFFLLINYTTEIFYEPCKINLYLFTGYT
jgi:hypothetical protein